MRTVRTHLGVGVDTLQERLASVGMAKSKRQIQRYELGRNVPPFAFVVAFERALGVPPGAVARCLEGQTLESPTPPALDQGKSIVPDGEPIDAADELLMLRGAELQERHRLMASLGLGSKGGRLVPYLMALGEESPGTGRVAARWLGAVITLMEEERDLAQLRDEFSEQFHPWEDLSPQDLADMGSALLLALRRLMRDSVDPTPQEWTKGG